ncbi:MAG: protein phosphatase 2C domain-containing protein [Gemmataceae bacterium]|nr:protein phosphatase 2C domain-containing protein [Gemmataceae bacterium]MDW8266641.1 protein phosphatase 2C domain-containing protein [Gemmataceae bacterium]
MSSNSPDPSQAGYLQSLAARLKGMTPPPAEIPVAAAGAEASAADLPVAKPINDAPSAAGEAPVAAPVVDAKAVSPPAICPVCGSPRGPEATYCGDCGFNFPADAGATAAAAPSSIPSVLKGRYRLTELVMERDGVQRFKATDTANGSAEPVIVLRAAAAVAEAVEAENDGEVLPDFGPSPGEVGKPAWPSIAWEKELLEKAAHPSLPRVADHFVEEGYEYLIESIPAGQSLWDAWDDPEATAGKRYSYLKQAAEALHQLHKHGAMVEFIKPDHITVTADGRAVLTELSELLPLPLPANVPLKASLYTAPELILRPQEADARANLYSFGAMIYSLQVTGRELTDLDFDPKAPQGTPKPFIPRFPDAHPLFARLMVKTFMRDPLSRFPTDEAAKVDPTGFTELIKVLETCSRTFDHAHLEIASWTTTGIVRTGNEDAFALIYASESRQDDMTDYALILLADGMGGYEAGEIASALAIQTLRKALVGHKMFSALAGGNHPDPKEFNVEECKQLILSALKEANKVVFQAPKQGIGRRGMGCTAEVVYIDSQNLVVGHVGDSRTYHLHRGQLKQITRDQTLVNRLIELGQITPEEAETHPRRSELQQAIGGRSEVEPAIYSAKISPGDWVLVCSDGLINHVKNDELREMMSMEATSAETAARRLINLVNLRNATDNTTVVVVRAMSNESLLG